jgi:hypothetical protein
MSEKRDRAMDEIQGALDGHLDIHVWGSEQISPWMHTEAVIAGTSVDTTPPIGMGLEFIAQTGVKYSGIADGGELAARLKSLGSYSLEHL